MSTTLNDDFQEEVHNVELIDQEKCKCGCIAVTQGEDKKCSKCGIIGSITYECKKESSTSRLKISGSGSSMMQSTLDQGITADKDKIRFESVRKEFEAYNEQYRLAKHCEIPQPILDSTCTNFCNLTKRSDVKTIRNYKKQQLMAAMLEKTACDNNVSLSKNTITLFMKLDKGGLSKGKTLLKSYGINTLVNYDSIIETAKAALPALYRNSISNTIIVELLNISEEKHIGENSEDRSKVIALIYDIYRRLEPAVVISIDDYCKSLQIRKNTISTFSTAIRKYHSKFVKVYEDAGILTDVL